MTGFGRAENSQGENHALVEIRSLNGKQFDLNLRIPPSFKSREGEIRNLITAKTNRGSVDCTITLRTNGVAKPMVLNTDLIKYYYGSIKDVASELGLDSSQLLNAVLSLPEVVAPAAEELDELTWQLVEKTLEEALDELVEHRREEGKALDADIRSRVAQIQQTSQVIAELAPQRQVKQKEQIDKRLEEAVGKENIDANRLEQEIIYYLEKLDISEELLRLDNHCTYFLQLMDSGEPTLGKKLGFLLQEMGREINTTGSKAYDAEIQKNVVAMKDELEKIKEQILNIL